MGPNQQIVRRVAARAPGVGSPAGQHKRAVGAGELGVPQPRSMPPPGSSTSGRGQPQSHREQCEEPQGPTSWRQQADATRHCCFSRGKRRALLRGDTEIRGVRSKTPSGRQHSPGTLPELCFLGTKFPTKSGTAGRLALWAPGWPWGRWLPHLSFAVPSGDPLHL